MEQIQQYVTRFWRFDNFACNQDYCFKLIQSRLVQLKTYFNLQTWPHQIMCKPFLKYRHDSMTLRVVKNIYMRANMWNIWSFTMLSHYWDVTYQRFGRFRHGHCSVSLLYTPYSDSMVHGANMGPIWGRQTQVGPMLAPWTLLFR